MMLISDRDLSFLYMQYHTYIPTDDDIKQDQLRKTPETPLVDFVSRSCDVRLLIVGVGHPEYTFRSLLGSTRERGEVKTKKLF